MKHLLDSPICAKPSEARCDREEEERGIERWWAKRKERRRHAAHVNKCQELFWGGCMIMKAGVGCKSAANAQTPQETIKVPLFFTAGSHSRLFLFLSPSVSTPLFR